MSLTHFVRLFVTFKFYSKGILKIILLLVSCFVKSALVNILMQVLLYFEAKIAYNFKEVNNKGRKNLKIIQLKLTTRICLIM